MQVHRRSFLTGLGALIAAPAIVRVASIMPVKAFDVSMIAPYIGPANPVSIDALYGTLRLGDIITFEGIEAWDRLANKSAGRLRQFVVTATGPLVEGGIYPPIIDSGRYRTVVNRSDISAPRILLPRPLHA